MPNLLIEEDFGWPYKSIAGVDEAGRGPWAGPVYSAIVILNRNCIPEGINDSKKISFDSSIGDPNLFISQAKAPLPTPKINRPSVNISAVEISPA